MAASPEQAAREIKELAINQMKSIDYDGAWRTLQQAKHIFPELRNLDHMLFVCNLLRSVDARKPGFGVNWLQILCVPPSAHMATIQSQFKDFIDCLEVIKIEFPGTAIAQGILRETMHDFCKRKKCKHVNFQPVVHGMRSANYVTNTGSYGVLKRKLPAEDFSGRRVTRNSSYFNKCENLSNVEVVPKRVVFGSKCRDVDDHCQISRSEVSDLVIKNEEESTNELKMMKYDTQISGTLESKVVVEEVDDGISQFQSNNDDDGENHKVNSAKQTTETAGIMEREACMSSDFIKEQSLSSKLKVSLFEALPQSPHYKSLNAMSEKFCEPIIMGIESSFIVVANQIRCLVSAEDVKCNVGNISNQLMYLESMGYDVHKLKARIEELGRLADQKQASFAACQDDDNELKEWEAHSGAFEAENCMIMSLIADKEGEIQRLKEKLAANQCVINFQKAEVAEIEERREKRAEECCWLDSEIEWTAKLPW